MGRGTRSDGGNYPILASPGAVYDGGMHSPAVSIVVRSFNEAWALRGTLEGIRRQSFRDWELIVIDSGSTDGSQELIRAAAPRHFVQIQPQEYHPPRILNLGMKLARANSVVFLNADATPVDAHWLAPLVQVLGHPDVAAVFGRQVPRPDCHAVFAADYEHCFGPARLSAKWDHFFSMVSSGLRKEVWAKRGFLESMQYSEDDEYTRWCRAAGYDVVYVPESVVMHSHNYTPRQAYKRSFGEAWALAAVFNGHPSEVTHPARVAAGVLADAKRDLAFCARTRRLREWPRAVRIRWEQRLARRAGFKAGWAMHRSA
jgi:rhamnosyltransferase